MRRLGSDGAPAGQIRAMHFCHRFCNGTKVCAVVHPIRAQEHNPLRDGPVVCSCACPPLGAPGVWTAGTYNGLRPRPHGLAVRTPAFHAGDRRFESGWGY